MGRKLRFRIKEQLPKTAQEAAGNDLVTLFTPLYEDGAAFWIESLGFQHQWK